MAMGASEVTLQKVQRIRGGKPRRFLLERVAEVTSLKHPCLTRDYCSIIQCTVGIRVA